MNSTVKNLLHCLRYIYFIAHLSPSHSILPSHNISILFFILPDSKSVLYGQSLLMRFLLLLLLIANAILLTLAQYLQMTPLYISTMI